MVQLPPLSQGVKQGFVFFQVDGCYLGDGCGVDMVLCQLLCNMLCNASGFALLAATNSHAEHLWTEKQCWRFHLIHIRGHGYQQVVCLCLFYVVNDGHMMGLAALQFFRSPVFDIEQQCHLLAVDQSKDGLVHLLLCGLSGPAVFPTHGVKAPQSHVVALCGNHGLCTYDVCHGVAQFVGTSHMSRNNGDDKPPC